MVVVVLVAVLVVVMTESAVGHVGEVLRTTGRDSSMPFPRQGNT